MDSQFMDYDKFQLSPTNIKGRVNPIKPSQQIICQPSFINSNPHIVNGSTPNKSWLKFTNFRLKRLKSHPISILSHPYC